MKQIIEVFIFLGFVASAISSHAQTQPATNIPAPADPRGIAIRGPAINSNQRTTIAPANGRTNSGTALSGRGPAVTPGRPALGQPQPAMSLPGRPALGQPSATAGIGQQGATAIGQQGSTAIGAQTNTAIGPQSGSLAIGQQGTIVGAGLGATNNASAQAGALNSSRRTTAFGGTNAPRNVFGTNNVQSTKSSTPIR
jgi:hypothetical protein